MEKTKVKSFRVAESLWKDLAKIALAKKESRNSIIVRLISKYCEENSKVLIDKERKM